MSSRELSPRTELAGSLPLADAERSNREHFTLVFKGDLRKYRKNPHQTDTPFGRPVVVGLGNAFEDFDGFVERYDALLDALTQLWLRASVGTEAERVEALSAAGDLLARLGALDALADASGTDVAAPPVSPPLGMNQK